MKLMDYATRNWRATAFTALLGVFALTLHAMHLYAVFWWWDILTHTVSGAALGVLLYHVFDTRLDNPQRITFWSVLVFFVLVTIWEAWELHAGLAVTGDLWTPEIYGTDTVLDTALGLIGVLVGTEVLERL